MDKATTTFDKLKAAMTTTPILVLLDFSNTFVIEADASGVGTSVVLMQDGRPLGYTSKELSPSHLKMTIYDKEMLAIVHVVAKWRSYLIGQRFQIKTDHKSLKYFLE